jgi:hypothetical protein
VDRIRATLEAVALELTEGWGKVCGFGVAGCTTTEVEESSPPPKRPHPPINADRIANVAKRVDRCILIHPSSNKYLRIVLNI